MADYKLNFTAAEIDEKLSSIDNKQDKLTGTQGQIVGFDTEGNAVAQEAPEAVTSWNDLTDKPFSETATGGNTIYMPDDLSELESVETTVGTMYKISNITPTIAELESADYLHPGNEGIIRDVDGNEATYYIMSEADNWAAVRGANTLIIIAYKDNASSIYGVLPSSGMYAPSYGATCTGFASLTINGFTGFPDIKKLDSKYLDFNIDDYKNAILWNADQQKYYLPIEELKASATYPIPSSVPLEYGFLGHINNDEICIAIINGSNENANQYLDGKTIYSTDGKTWNIFENNNLSSNTPFVYGNGMFLKYGGIIIDAGLETESTMGVMFYSHDGINWDYYELPSFLPRSSIGYCVDKFIALSGTADWEYYKGAYSTDGLNWTSFDTPFEACLSLASNNNPENPLWIASTVSGIYYSSDGITWTSANTDISFYAFGCVNNVFIGVQDDGDIYASIDGQNWKACALNQATGYIKTDDFRNLTTDGINKAVVGLSMYSEEDSSSYGGFICIEADPDNEELIKAHFSLPSCDQRLPYCIYFKDRFISFGRGYSTENCPILYSVDGINWYYDFPFVDVNGDVIPEMVTNQSINLIDNLYKTKANNTPMTGATSDTDGTSGLVPAPAAGDEGKFLKGDGTWGEAASSFVINATGTMDDFAIDASYADIQAAIQSGKQVSIDWFTEMFSHHVIFTLNVLMLDNIMSFSCSYNVSPIYYDYVVTITKDDVVTIDGWYSTSVNVQKTLSSSSWVEQSDGTYAQTITDSHVTASNNISIDCALTGSDKDANIAILQGWGCVNDCKQAEGTLTFYCYGDLPTVNVPISVVVM